MLEKVGRQMSKLLGVFLFLTLMVGSAQAAYYFDNSKFSISNITKGTAGSANDERVLASSEETDIIE